MANNSVTIPTEYPGIKQRKSDGKYIVQLDLGRELRQNKKTGEMELRQVKTTRVVNSMKEARALQAENEREKRQSKKEGTRKRKTLFKEVAESYFEHMQDTWSENNMIQRRAQKNRCIAYFGNQYITEIDTLDIEKFFKWCRSPHGEFAALQNATIINMKSFLSGVWVFAKKNREYGIKENVVTDASTGKADKFEGYVVPLNDLNYMLNYAATEKDKSNYTIVLLAGFCGLRRGEILGLTWDKIDPANNDILIDKQRCQSGNDIYHKLPKNDKIRHAAIAGKVWEALQEVKGDKYVYHRDCTEAAIPSKVSKYFNQFQNRMNKKREKEGLEPLRIIRIHDLRHTFISYCLNNGINPLQVSAAVGHEVRGSTTVNTYWHDQGNRSDITNFIDSIINLSITH